MSVINTDGRSTWMENVVLPGEAEAIAAVIELGRQYGYGNLISCLRDAWKKDLMEKYGTSDEAADLLTRV